MPEESNATTEASETTSTKATVGRKAAAKKGGQKRKPKQKVRNKEMGAKKKTASKKPAKKVAVKKKTAAADGAESKRGKEPLKAMRLLLLDQDRPGRSGPELAGEVACTTNFVYKVRSESEKYAKEIEALSPEQRKQLLSEQIPLKGKSPTAGTKKVKPAPHQSPSNGQGAVADFRRALRLVGLERARQLLDAFEREE